MVLFFVDEAMVHVDFVSIQSMPAAVGDVRRFHECRQHWQGISRTGMMLVLKAQSDDLSIQ